MSRAVIMAKARIIEPADLDLAGVENPTDQGSLRETRQRVERQTLLEVLTRHRGNVSQAAREAQDRAGPPCTASSTSTRSARRRTSGRIVARPRSASPVGPTTGVSGAEGGRWDLRWLRRWEARSGAPKRSTVGIHPSTAAIPPCGSGLPGAGEKS